MLSTAMNLRNKFGTFKRQANLLQILRWFVKIRYQQANNYFYKPRAVPAANIFSKSEIRCCKRLINA